MRCSSGSLSVHLAVGNDLSRFRLLRLIICSIVRNILPMLAVCSLGGPISTTEFYIYSGACIHP